MRTMHLLSVTTALAAAILASVPGIAEAAPPGNDSAATPTEVGALPFEATQDTTEATTDDPSPANYCYDTQHSVWFHLKTAEARRLAVTTAGSNYTTSVNVYEANDPDQPVSAWSMVDCSNGWDGPGSAAVAFNAQADHDYYVMVSPIDSSGGSLDIQVRRAVRDRATLAARGHVDRIDGTATVHGTVQCTRPARARISVTVSQASGDRVVRGQRDRWIACGPEQTSWRMRIVGNNDRPFHAGPARVGRTWHYACESNACSEGRRFDRSVVRLVR